MEIDSFDFQSIKFIKENDLLIPTNKDCFDAFKIIRNNDIFYLKLLKDKIDINLLKKKLEIYKLLKIKTLDIIDVGYINNGDPYIIYNFIDGTNLKEYTNEGNFKFDDIRALGKCVGKELLKLKEYKNYDKNLFCVRGGALI